MHRIADSREYEFVIETQSGVRHTVHTKWSDDEERYISTCRGDA